MIVDVDPVVMVARPRIDDITRSYIGLAVGVALVCICGIVVGWPTLTLVWSQIHPPGPRPCATPSGEARLLQAYQREPALVTVTPPDATPQATPSRSGLYHYCDSIGVDRPTWANGTAVWRDYDATGWWPSDRLRSRYQGGAATGGWSYVRQADQDPASPGSCFTVLHGGTPYCEGDGVLYCRAIEGVTTFLEVSDYSRADRPNDPTWIRIEVEAQWNIAVCPSPSYTGSRQPDPP